MVEITFTVILQILQTAGILVGIFYYLMVLRNQEKNQNLTIETRQVQLFMQMHNRFNEKVDEIEVKGFDIITTLQGAKVKTADDFVHLWENDEPFFKTIRAITSFSEGLGVLVKEGLLNIRYVALMWAGPTRMFWDLVGPILPDLAKHWNYPRLWSETEYLCKELVKYMEEHPELAT